MPFFKTPGVYIVEQPGPKTIQPIGTSTAAFLGQAPQADAHLNEAVAVNNWSEFRTQFASSEGTTSTVLSHAVAGFFQNRGSRCFVVNLKAGDAIAGGDRPRSGLKLLEEIDEISIVAAPGYSDAASHEALLAHAEKLGDRVAILDPPLEATNPEFFKTVEAAGVAARGKDADAADKPAGGLHPRIAPKGHGTFYYPGLIVGDALNPKADLVAVPASGHMAGIWARTDATRGVHKAPANEPVLGAVNLTYRVTSEEQAELNSRGVNVIRFFSNDGILVWGARTLAEESSEWRFLNVRRLFIMIEQSILRATKWAVFEPNDRTLWKTLRSEVTGFLRNVYRDGALMGATPEQAFFVKCDEETNPPDSVDLGQVVTVIGIAPVKPAEFIVFKIAQQAAGAQAETL
jgi:phage tail sheath protein FI